MTRTHDFTLTIFSLKRRVFLFFFPNQGKGRCHDVAHKTALKSLALITWSRCGSVNDLVLNEILQGGAHSDDALRHLSAQLLEALE